MIRNYQTITVVLMMMLISLSGCFGETEEEAVPVIQGFFDFDQELDNRTWYHYPGGEDAQNNTSFWAEIMFHITLVHHTTALE